MKPNFGFGAWLVLFLAAVCFAQPAQAQDQASPHAAYTYFIAKTSRETWEPQKAAKVIYGPNLSLAEREQLAIRLRQVMDGKGLYLPEERIPRDPRHTDTLAAAHLFIPFPQVPQLYMERYGTRWYWSEHTVELIPELHRQVYPFGSHRLVGLLQKFGTQDFMGVQLWQMMGLLLLLTLAWLLHFGINYFLCSFLTRASRRLWPGTSMARKDMGKVSKPISLFVAALLLLVLLPVLQFDAVVNRWSVIVIHVALISYATMVFYRLSDTVVDVWQQRTAESDSKLDQQLIPLARKVLKSFVVVIGFIILLQNLNIDVTALLAGLSIGGLALALAAQDTVKNFFGSLMIFMDKPFTVGDWIKTDNIDGTVEEVGFRSTRVRTFQNSVVTVPNGKLADIAVDNMGLRLFRRYRTHISITYDAAPQQVEAFVQGLRQIALNHPAIRKDKVTAQFTDFGDTALLILFQVFFEVPDYFAEVECRHEINLKIMRLSDALGVRFAFPTQTLHIEEMPGHPSLTSSKEGRDFNADLQDFLRREEQTPPMAE